MTVLCSANPKEAIRDAHEKLDSTPRAGTFHAT